LWKETLEESF
jgi:dynein heavy chain